MVDLAERIAKLVESMATGLEGSKGDCKAARGALAALDGERNAVLIEMTKFPETDTDPTAKAWFESTYAPRIKAGFARAEPIVTKCATDAAFTQAMHDFVIFPDTRPSGPTKPVPRPPGVSDAMAAALEAEMANVESFMADLQKVGVDCTKAAAVVDAHMDAMVKAGVETKKYENRDPAIQQWLLAQQGDRLTNAMAKGKATIDACQADPKFLAAMNKFPL